MVLKVTTQSSNIASVHVGGLDNVAKLYRVLEAISGSFNWLFSEPKFIKKEAKIEWHTDLIGEAISYEDADSKLQNEIASILKVAVGNILLGKKQEQIDLIKGALEIPSLEDIFYIEGKVVLTQWGHIQNSYNAKRGIIFELIKNRTAKLTILALQNGEPLPNEPLLVEWKNQTIKTITDREGETTLFVPLEQEIRVKFRESQEKFIAKDDSIYFKFNLITAPPPPPEPEPEEEVVEIAKEPFLIKIEDCQNSLPIVGDGKIIVEVGEEMEEFPITGSEVKITKWFGEVAKINSAVEGYITDGEIEMRIESGKSAKICLYPMVELEREGAIGDPRFNISWKPSREDIDIIVITPCGTVIYFDNERVECKGFEGRLDIDIREAECEQREEDCQENITFDNGGARGKYQVIVKKYDGTENPTEIVLTVVNNGEQNQHKFILKKPKEQKVFEIIH